MALYKRCLLVDEEDASEPQRVYTAVENDDLDVKFELESKIVIAKDAVLDAISLARKAIQQFPIECHGQFTPGYAKRVYSKEQNLFDKYKEEVRQNIRCA
jgi:hypothetical protein